jgi:hypothetical protein
MALTLRTNGSSGVNLVTAAWWNDFYNLLTGVMTDQPVTISNTLTVKGASFTFLTSAAFGLIINDNSPNVQMVAQAPAGSARGFTLAGIDTGGSGHAGLQVNSDGSAQIGALDTSTSGIQLIKIYTGTTTPPTTGPDGSLWFKG